MTTLALKRVATARPSNVDKKTRDGEVPVRLCNYTDVYYESVIRDDADFMEATATPEQVRTFRLRHGDVVITKDSETADDIGVPAFVDSPGHDLVCGYHLAMIRPQPSTLDGRYLYWQLSSTPVLAHWATEASGVTRFGLRSSTIENLPIRVPAMAEQRAIADFLDIETARIDALIATKQALVDALSERWFGALAKAFGGALTDDGGAPGLEWLGPVPAGWGTPTVGHRYEVLLGKMLSPTAAAGPTTMPYLRNTNVQWDCVDTDDVNVMHFDRGELARYRVEPGDLLVCEGGYVGRSAVWQGPGSIQYQKALHRLRPYNPQEDEPRFLMYFLWLASSMKVFNVQGNTSTIVHLTGEQLRAQRFPRPQMTEQRRVVRDLDQLRERLRRLETKIGLQLDKLQEHRQALITAAVTGQMDVPGVAA